MATRPELSGAIPVTSQSAMSASLRSSSPQTREQSPGRSSRLIGPRMANVIVRDSVEAIDV